MVLGAVMVMTGGVIVGVSGGVTVDDFSTTPSEPEASVDGGTGMIVVLDE